MSATARLATFQKPTDHEIDHIRYRLGHRDVFLIRDPSDLVVLTRVVIFQDPVLIVACPLNDVKKKVTIGGAVVVLCDDVSTKKGGSVDVVASRILYHGDESLQGEVSLIYDDEGEMHFAVSDCPAALRERIKGAVTLLSDAIAMQEEDKRKADADFLAGLSRLYELAKGMEAPKSEVARFFALKFPTVTRVALASLT